MSAALTLTGADLVRALGAVKALPAVDTVIARRADDVAGALARAGTETRVLKRGDGDYLVTVSGAGVFAREFGSVAEPAAPFIAAALAEAGKP